MATEVRTFDLYNTTNIWLGYSIDGYETEQLVTVAYYNSQFSSNPIGSQVDFFIDIPSVDLPYFWKKYWWDQAVYYSNPLVLSAIQIINTNYYKSFSESLGLERQV